MRSFPPRETASDIASLGLIRKGPPSADSRKWAFGLASCGYPPCAPNLDRDLDVGWLIRYVAGRSRTRARWWALYLETAAHSWRLVVVTPSGAGLRCAARPRP